MFYYLFNYTMSETSKKGNCILSQQMVMYIWIKKQQSDLEEYIYGYHKRYDHC